MTKYDLQEFEDALRRRLTDAKFGHVGQIIAVARSSLDSVIRQEGLMTTKEAAAYLGVSATWILQRLWDKRLPGNKRGWRWFIRESDLLPYKNKKKSVGGRPKKFNVCIPTEAR